MTLQSVSRVLITSQAAVRSWRVVLYLLIVVVTGVALVPSPSPVVDTGWDKANHLLAFAALAAAACFGFPGSRLRGWAIAAALLAFGGMIEVLQMSFSGRSASWADLLADLFGIAIGLLLAGWLTRAACPHGGHPSSSPGHQPSRDSHT